MPSQRSTAGAPALRQPRLWRWLLAAGVAMMVVAYSRGHLRQDASPPPTPCATGAAAHLVAPPSNAGCMLKADQRLLAVRDRRSGRWGFPAGRPEGGEPPACTAVRETREETGLVAVAVTALAVYEGDFVLFGCTAPALSAAVTPAVPPGPVGTGEILEIAWLDPHTLAPQNWRFPAQVTDVRVRFAAFAP